MKKLYAIINLLSVIAVVAWNGWVGANGLNGNTVASLSDKYDNLFTPADYAFSIWGLIFLALIITALYQIKKNFFDVQKDEFIRKIGPWFAIANVLNCAWLWFWLQEQTLISVFVMIGILLSLIIVMIRLKMQITIVSTTQRVLVWAPIALYAGWISVATIANVTSYLTKMGWSVGFSETIWAVIMVTVAFAVNVLVVLNRKMPVFGAVGVWALTAIAVRHWGTEMAIQWTSLITAIFLAVIVVAQYFKNRNLST